MSRSSCRAFQGRYASECPEDSKEFQVDEAVSRGLENENDLGE